MSSSCGKYCSILQDHTTKDVSAAMNGMEKPAFREQVATNNHEEVHAASSLWQARKILEQKFWGCIPSPYF